MRVECAGLASSLGSTPPPPEPHPPDELPAPPFGEAGQFVVTGASIIGVSSTQYSASDASSFAATFSPGLDVFVVRGVSVGIDADLGYSSAKGYAADGKLIATTATTLAGGLRFGFNVPLSTLVSFYPRLTLGFESVRRTEIEPGGSTFAGSSHWSTESSPFVSAFAPLLLHPKPHFFLGVGPNVFHALGGAQGGSQAGVEQTTIGGHFVVGGWWGGAAPAADVHDVQNAPDEQDARDAPPPPYFPPLARAEFGEPGRWVFTGEVGGGVAATKRTGGDASTAGSFEPGFDVFVGNRISVGASALFAQGHSVVTPPGGGPSTTTDVTSFGGAARLGGDVRLSSLASFYPRASFAVSRQSYDERSGSARNAASSTAFTLRLFVPLLLHITTHLFVGFGPTIDHDVLRSIDDRRGDNLATRVGAGLIVGGWL